MISLLTSSLSLPFFKPKFKPHITTTTKPNNYQKLILHFIYKIGFPFKSTLILFLFHFIFIKREREKKQDFYFATFYFLFLFKYVLEEQKNVYIYLYLYDFEVILSIEK